MPKIVVFSLDTFHRICIRLDWGLMDMQLSLILVEVIIKKNNQEYFPHLHVLENKQKSLKVANKGRMNEE